MNSSKFAGAPGAAVVELEVEDTPEVTVVVALGAVRVGSLRTGRLSGAVVSMTPSAQQSSMDGCDSSFTARCGASLSFVAHTGVRGPAAESDEVVALP